STSACSCRPFALFRASKSLGRRDPRLLSLPTRPSSDASRQSRERNVGPEAIGAQASVGRRSVVLVTLPVVVVVVTVEVGVVVDGALVVLVVVVGGFVVVVVVTRVVDVTVEVGTLVVLAVV